MGLPLFRDEQYKRVLDQTVAVETENKKEPRIQEGRKVDEEVDPDYRPPAPRRN